MGVTFVPLEIEVPLKFTKTLKRLAALSDNRSFQAQGLSVAFCKLMQSLSITAIRGSAEMLLARAPCRLFCFLCARPLGGEMVDPVLLLSLSTDMIKGSASMILRRSFWPDLTNSE